MSAAVQTAVNMADHRVHSGAHPRAEIRERSFKSTVALMSLPQSVLQTYIGIAYALHSTVRPLRTDLFKYWIPVLFLTAAHMLLIHPRSYSRFDPSSGHYDRILIGSVLVSVIGSGVNAVAAERLFRNDMLGPIDSAIRVETSHVYMLLTCVCRTVQTVALVGWVSLLCCQLGPWASFPGLVSLVFYVEMQKEADGHRKSVWPAVRWAFGFGLLLALLSALFFQSSPSDNNFFNVTLAPAPVGSPQHLDCRLRNTTHSVIYFCSWLSVPLLLVSLVADPQHGWRLWRELAEARLKGSKEERYLSADEFSSSWSYARYMHAVCHVGMRVRAIRTVGSNVGGPKQIAIHDEGVITRVDRHTCVCDWKQQCYESGRRWIEWQDIEVLSPYPTGTSQARDHQHEAAAALTATVYR